MGGLTVLHYEEKIMKHMFIKSMAIAATLMLAWNCTDDSSTSSPNADNNVPELTVTANTWLLLSGQTGYLIHQPNETGAQVVTDTRSNPVGIYDASTGNILDTEGNIILMDVKLNDLLIVTPQRTIIGLDGSETRIDDGVVVKPADPPQIPDQPASSSAPAASVATSSSAPASSATIPSSADTAKVSSSSAKDSTASSSSAKSSSSSAKSSSSSEQKSSSSKGGNNDPEASKYENAGKGGQQGWATRYWDCCMPSCAWNENSGGNPTKTCDAKGKNFVQGGQNICAGGQNTTCTSQIPIIASDKVAYAFAATHASGGKCGKCFALTFTGSGKYETKANHQALAGKTLVVMASNIGGDVDGNQFDVMIPGGGLGQFDGCGQMGWGNQGEKFGGLLSNCENEVGYDGDLLNKRKECLSRKCNEVFKNDEQAKEGCMFLATWMEAAGNPNFESKEVECPQALKAKW